MCVQLESKFVSKLTHTPLISFFIDMFFTGSLSFLAGDLGQTFDSLSTLEHYMNSSGQSVLFVGDLSYADTYPFHNNIRWDTWSRLIEPSAAFQPWILTAGNHELDFLPEFVSSLALTHYLHVVSFC